MTGDIALPVVWLALVLALICINTATFASFGIDKRRARTGRRRLSEGSLLGLAALGGTPGAYLGRRHFRHKTRKAGFSRSLHLIAAAQLACVIWFIARP